MSTADALEQLSHDNYQRDGFVVARGLVGTTALGLVDREIESAFAQPPTTVTPQGVPIVVCWRHHVGGARTIVTVDELPALSALVRSAAMLDLAAHLTGAKQLQLFETIVFNKPPGEGEPFAWHNDASYYPFDPTQLVSTWIALDPCDAASGAMELARGSHRVGAVAPVHVKTGASLVDATTALVPSDPTGRGFEVMRPVLAPGDAVVFDGFTWHASQPNRSARQRRGLCIRYLTHPARFAPELGFGGAFARQITTQPGELISSPAFPVLWAR